MQESTEIQTQPQLTPIDWNDEQERVRYLNSIRKAINKVHHDLSNPLTIITGNAQFFLEVSKMMDMEADIVQPVRDIEAAAQHMSEILDRLILLKEMLPHQHPGGQG